jgi:hypothetical protein
VRAPLVLIAIVVLVAFGTGEAVISNHQLSELPGRGRPVLSSGGAALTVIGVLGSAFAYVLLGLLLPRNSTGEGTALRIGALVGAAAGLIGGAIRAYLIRDYLGDVLADYGLGDLLLVTLAVFVALSVVVSVAAGASLTWLGFRGGRRRQTRRPQS